MASDNMVDTVTEYYDGLKARLKQRGLMVVVATIMITMVGFIGFGSLGTIIYKVSLISMAAVIGWWLDYAIFPYARPHSIISKLDFDRGENDHRYTYAGMCQLRRTLIILASVIGVGMGI